MTTYINPSNYKTVEELHADLAWVDEYLKKREPIIQARREQGLTEQRIIELEAEDFINSRDMRDHDNYSL